jgi:hypothetical protein
VFGLCSVQPLGAAMSDVVYLADFRRPTAKDRVVRAMSVMSDSDQKAFADRVARALAARRHTPSPEERDKRAAQWRMVVAEIDYWSALHRMADACSVVAHVGLWPLGQLPHLVGTDLDASHKEIAQRRRETAAKLLMTPAAFQADVDRKYRIVRSGDSEALGLTRQQIEAQIAADEAFLKACPRRERGTRRGRRDAP